MLNEDEKEELRRIINKFVEQRRCFRPRHPDEVLKEVNRFKRTHDWFEEVDPVVEPRPRFQL